MTWGLTYFDQFIYLRRLCLSFQIDSLGSELSHHSQKKSTNKDVKGETNLYEPIPTFTALLILRPAKLSYLVYGDTNLLPLGLAFSLLS